MKRQRKFLYPGKPFVLRRPERLLDVKPQRKQKLLVVTAHRAMLIKQFGSKKL